MDISLIGYGEVGRILAADLRAQGHNLRAFDTKFGTPAAPPLRKHAEEHGVVLASSHAAAARGAELVISAVTADQTVAAAVACAPGIAGTFYLDFNSASPAAKLTAGRDISAAGGRYVEGAVMAAVPPYRLKVPMLLGGPHAAELLPVLDGLGFAAKFASEKLGVASATKLCRSVMIKGLEALVLESFTAARHYGVEDAVIASLKGTFPSIDWEQQGAYYFQRVIEHGRRRSEEMRESAKAVDAAGFEPFAASAIADRQAWLADLADQGLFGERGSAEFAKSKDWRTEADRILVHLNHTSEG